MAFILNKEQRPIRGSGAPPGRLQNPHAGCDLGALTTSAVKNADG